MNRAIVIIFLLGGSVKLLDIAYTHLVRPKLMEAVATSKKGPPRPPAFYSEADRLRDLARAARLRRDAERNPTLARLLREQRERRGY